VLVCVRVWEWCERALRCRAHALAGTTRPSACRRAPPAPSRCASKQRRSHTPHLHAGGRHKLQLARLGLALLLLLLLLLWGWRPRLLLPLLLLLRLRLPPRLVAHTMRVLLLWLLHRSRPRHVRGRSRCRLARRRRGGGERGVWRGGGAQPVAHGGGVAAEAHV
jgi:hypothetical protein